jgi:hypothetical protein
MPSDFATAFDIGIICLVSFGMLLYHSEKEPNAYSLTPPAFPVDDEDDGDLLITKGG